VVEILIILAVVAVVGAIAYRYVASTAKTVEKLQEERPLAGSRLAADQATVVALQAAIRTYQATNGKPPETKDAALGLLAGPPRYQCPGNDVEYDPITGGVRLLITDLSRC
jgi:hypothetical protein